MSRQRAAGARTRAATRRRLLDAAGREFVAQGYAGATVTRIAASAGVSVQTLYTVGGSKRDLLRALFAAVLADDDDPAMRFADELDPATAADAGEVVDRLAALFVGVAERVAPLWRVYQDAAAIDREIAADWDELQRRRRETIRGLVSTLPPSTLDRGGERDADTVWALASPETWQLLVDRAGYTAGEYREWLAATLRAAILRR